MEPTQTLHLVFGGQVTDPQTTDFSNLDKLDIVGIFPNYDEAEKAWRNQSQRNVDDAMTKYVIVPFYKLLEPSAD